MLASGSSRPLGRAGTWRGTSCASVIEVPPPSHGASPSASARIDGVRASTSISRARWTTAARPAGTHGARSISDGARSLHVAISRSAIESSGCGTTPHSSRYSTMPSDHTSAR